MGSICSKSLRKTKPGCEELNTTLKEKGYTTRMHRNKRGGEGRKGRGKGVSGGSMDVQEDRNGREPLSSMPWDTWFL